MRRLRIALIVVSALLVPLLLAAWLVPPQLDWGRYRTSIAQIASARLGLPVTIQGPVTLALLPEPVLTAGQVGVGSPAGGAQIRVAALRLRLALLPLLAGRIDARELVLRGPDLHIPWPAQPGHLPYPPAWLSAFDARVEDGTLSIGQFTVTGIHGDLSSRAPDSLAASVSATIAGQRWTVSSRLTAAGPDGGAGLELRLDGQGRAAGTVASFIGRFSPQGALAGSVKAAGPDLSLLLPAPAEPFSAAGRLTVADGLAEADELAVRLAGAPAAGAVALRMLPHPRLDIALSAMRLDLDPWRTVLLAHATDRLLLPVGFDFSAEAATLAGATLRHLRATFELNAGSVAVQEVAARLPGEGALSLSGRIVRTETGAARFAGNASLHAPVLRATLSWLLPRATPVVDELPPDVAQRAGLDGHVVLQPGRVVLDRLHGTLDGSAVGGSLEWKDGTPPEIAANLQFDHLPLDAWVADAALRQTMLKRFDADLRLSVQHASLGGTPISGLQLDASSVGGGVRLRRLQAAALGADLLASGTLDASSGLTGGSLALTATDGGKLAALLPAAWRATPGFWHGPVRLRIEASGPPQALAASLHLSLGDLHLRAQPTIDLLAGTATGSLTLRDPNAGRLVSELGLPPGSGLDGVPAWLGEGSLSLVAQFGASSARRILLDNAQLVAGRLRTRLQLALDLGQASPELTGTVAAETLPLPLPDVAPLPVGLLHGWQAQLALTANRVLAPGVPVLDKAAGTLSLAQGRLHLAQLRATLAGGSLAADLALDASQTPPSLAVQATLRGASIDGPLTGLPIDITAGHADLALALTASGYSEAALAASLSGRLQATLHDGSLSGIDLGGLRSALRAKAGDAALRAALSGGRTPFLQLHLNGVVADGIVSLDQAALRGEAGTVQASGSLALPDASADLRLMLHPDLPDGPDIPVQITGALATPQRIPGLAALARWRNAQPAGQ